MIHNVQFARVLAAMMVVFFHVAEAELVYTSYTTVVRLFHFFGFSGVDLFFVISGFIIFWVSNDVVGLKDAGGRRLAAILFLHRRAVRIFPIYWIFAAVMFALLWSSGSAALQEVTPEGILLEFSILGNIDRPFILIPVAWTLAFEVYFYIMFSLCIFLPSKISRLFGVTLIVLHLLFIAVAVVREPELRILRFLSSPLHIEFVMGVLIAVAASRGRFVAPIQAIVCGALLFILGAIFYFYFEGADLPGPIVGLVRVGLFGCGSALLLAGLVSFELGGGRRAPTMFGAFGDASYSIYLGHLMVFAVIRNTVPVFGLAAFPTHVVTMLLMVIGAVAVGLLSFRYIEKPLNLALRGPRTLVPTW